VTEEGGSAAGFVEFRDSGPTDLDLDVGDQYRRAFLDEPLRCGLADTARCAGDQCHPSFESFHCRSWSDGHWDIQLVTRLP